jgi:hypothetical protein
VRCVAPGCTCERQARQVALRSVRFVEFVIVIVIIVIVVIVVIVFLLVVGCIVVAGVGDRELGDGELYLTSREE